MFGWVAQRMKLNPKLFLVDIKSFADSAQLSSAIGKSSKILVIFFSKGKLWTVGLADPDRLAIWRGSVQLGSIPKVKQRPHRSGLLDSFSVENQKHKSCYWRLTLRTWNYPSEFGCLAESRRRETAETWLPSWQIKDEILVPSQMTESEGLDMLLLNGLADPLGMELLKL